ncbi:unnamed protein product [Ectocarpus sp. 6 AP-2014]
MVVALEHRHDRNEPDHDEDAYSRSGDVPGMDVVSAGSVTSFVRKLFQMVQGECDSIVGFVADGTAFEVKDPRRLEQDILPKYFRHSRFQSLVRQLNFYSFKKISKERSVWIYKHAFFRRDEPELLHALKRKTNQHGAPARVGGGVAGLGVGDGGADDMMVVDRVAPIVGGSLSRDPLDSNKARSRGLSFLPPRHADGGGSAFRPPHHDYHHSPSFSNQHQEHHQHRPHYPHHRSSNGDRHSSRSSRPPHHPHPAHRKNGSSSSGSGRMYRASSSRGAGGGPSTGGAAVPSYGGQGPSSRGGAPDFAWAGAGGRPVSSSGGPGVDYDRRSGGVDGGNGNGMRATKAGGHRGFDDGRSPSSSSSSQAYSRQGPAIGDDRGSALGRQRGCGNGGPAAAAAAGGGAGGGGVTDKDHALALFGLSALCQVASATEAPAAHDKESIGQMDEDGGGGSGGGGRGSRRLSDVVDRQPQKRHRGVGPEADAGSRRGWAAQESSGDDEREEEEEDGVTSAERDDSSLSNHRRSPSNSSCVSSSSSSSNSLVSSADSSDGGFERHHHGSTDNGVFVQPPPPPTTTTTTDAKKTVPRQQQQQRTSGSGGVFCPTWDWGRAACEPAIRLPGSFVDRRFEEVDQQVVKDDDDDDDDESSRAEEEEREQGESRQEFAQESDDEGPEARPDNGSAAHRRGAAMAITDEASPHVSVSLAGSDEPRPTPTAAVPPRPRDAQADMKAEADVGLDGIGAFFSHCCSAAAPGNDTTRASESVFLATVANSGDGGLREMAVFCAGPAGKAPDAAPAAYLAREVSLFLQGEEAVAEDLRVYAEALDPAAVDVVVEGSLGSSSNPAAVTQPLSPDGAKLLRVFCRFAACRLGRALEVASLVAESAEEAAAGGGGGGGDKAAEQQGLLLQRHGAFARRVAPQLDSCRWKWWRAAVRFS